MTQCAARTAHKLCGRWRIVEADLWDRSYLDLCGSAMLNIGTDGTGEIAFGALTASLNIAFARDSIDFDWSGSDEGDQIDGNGHAELQADSSLTITFSWHNGDEPILTAKRDNSSTAC